MDAKVNGQLTETNTFLHPADLSTTREHSFNMNHSQPVTLSEDELNLLSLDSIVELLEPTPGQTHFQNTTASPAQNLLTVNKGNLTEPCTLPKESAVARQMVQNPKKYTTTPIKPTSLTRWTPAEEIILQGAVIDCNLAFGTQSSWRQISQWFHAAAKEYAWINNEKPNRQRSSCALKKHYRCMHDRARSENLGPKFWYKAYHCVWLSDKFNANNRLIDFTKL